MKIEILGINFSIKVQEKTQKQNESKKPVEIKEDKPYDDNWINWWP